MWLAVVLLACALSASALDNGLNTKPALGFNTWNAFYRDIHEDLVKEHADLMVSMGLRDVGFKYLVLDDCWAQRPREKGEKLQADKQKFPSGMKAMGDYIHSKGLQYGIYSDAGTLTCAKYPGSLDHEELDAQTFADWEVDYLKYDNCHVKREAWVVDRYTAMRDALNSTGRPILYSLCEWGVMEPHLWASEIGNSWRTTEDIRPFWDSIIKTLDYNVGLARFAGPQAGWNDLDMLYVGNDTGLNHAEQRTHFALWSLYKSPLMIGHDLRDFSPASLSILLSKEVIAINQDDLGVAGDLVWRQGTKRVYAGPLAGGDRAVVLANFGTLHSQYPTTNLTVFWQQIGLQPGQRVAVRDLYAEEDLGEFVDSFTAAVAVHDVLALRLTPLDGPLDESWRPWHGQPVYAAQPEHLASQAKESWIGQDAPWKSFVKYPDDTVLPIFQQPSEGRGSDKKNRRRAFE